MSIPQKSLGAIVKEVEENNKRPVVFSWNPIDNYGTGEEIIFRDRFKAAKTPTPLIARKSAKFLAVHYDGPASPGNHENAATIYLMVMVL